MGTGELYAKRWPRDVLAPVQGSKNTPSRFTLEQPGEAPAWPLSSVEIVKGEWSRERLDVPPLKEQNTLMRSATGDLHHDYDFGRVRSPNLLL